jgi:hypothetical protein
LGGGEWLVDVTNEPNIPVLGGIFMPPHAKYPTFIVEMVACFACVIYHRLPTLHQLLMQLYCSYSYTEEAGEWQWIKATCCIVKSAGYAIGSD